MVYRTMLPLFLVSSVRRGKEVVPPESRLTLAWKKTMMKVQWLAKVCSLLCIISLSSSVIFPWLALFPDFVIQPFVSLSTVSLLVLSVFLLSPLFWSTIVVLL